MTLDKLIDLLLQKGFTAVTGAMGLKLIVVDAVIAGDNKIEILAIGAVLLSVATVISYLVWRTRFSITQQKSIAADQSLSKELSGNP
jgi:metal-dependent HD superfamily phosphatase/phosphodiesterase|tara:strand:- start:12584 stop:12844 length:261 start_codon:yes stop_codon:yes gene_type:complete